MMMNMGDLIKVRKIIKIGQGRKIMTNTLRKEIANIILIKIKGLKLIITLIIRTIRPMSGEEGIKCKMIGTLRNSRNRIMTIRIQNITLRIKDILLKILTTNIGPRINTRMNINVRMMTVYKTVTNIFIISKDKG
jgi:hypothetical protein